MLCCVGLLGACGKPAQVHPAPLTAGTSAPPTAQEPSVEALPTISEAQAFLREVDAELRARVVAASVADWEKSTDITDAHERRAAEANEALMAYTSEAIRRAQRFVGLPGLSAGDARKLELLRRSTSLPAPPDAAAREELAAIASKMESLYGKGKVCPEGAPRERCQTLEQLEDVLAESRDPATLRAAWEGWHDLGAALRPLYTRYVTLANQGAQAIGYADLGALWRGRYDMPPEAFEADLERLWTEVRPLYEALHCYARAKLRARYGAAEVPAEGPIPAHLLGNMWAQDWSNLYPLLEPYRGQGELTVSKALQKQGYDAVRMVRLGESFFTSLGLPKLPESFWQRSMLTRPVGREVVCHASAWDVHYDNDLRIKMCTKIDQEDLITIHHELGHIYYFSQYYQLPILFQDGANDGFHEAIGDAIALSITPAYLVRVGLLARAPRGEKGALNQLMQRALDKVAFLPFGKVVDSFRWKVFSGEIAPSDYNRSWWKMRAAVQGVSPPSERGEEHFDPGAKYHVAANVPYARYFLATVLQYQFHRALCKIAGHEGPLHACSIYGNREAGERLRQMLALGAERPWPDALEALTGERRLDATAIVDYFAPLMAWLRTQNQGQRCGF